MTDPKPTAVTTENTEELLADLDGGTLLQKLGRAIRDSALGTVAHGGNGKVALELTFKRVGESMQVECKHAIKTSVPTKRGKMTEDSTTSTPLYVAGNGRVSLFPVQQQTSMFDNDKA